jgi:hypothetical protein
MNLFSGVTNQYSKPDILAMPFHWHVNVGYGGTPLEYHTLCGKLSGPKTMYVRPTSATRGFDLYPPQMMSAKCVKDAWWLSKWPDEKPENMYRYYFDIRRPEVREKVIDWMILQLDILERDTLCIDNMGYMTGNPSGVSAVEWTDAERLLLKELRKTGAPFFINVACSVGLIPKSIMDFGALAEGYFTENPFHPNMVNLDPGHNMELTAYKWYASTGRTVLLGPPQSRFDETCNLVEGIRNIFVCARKD